MIEPLQLVAGDGKTLRIVEENLFKLKSLTLPIDVIAVVGPFHSGKSFLLNKLMGLDKQDGFKLGYTVEPTTKGIWCDIAYLFTSSFIVYYIRAHQYITRPLSSHPWCRMRVFPRGAHSAVIFLDTEGFAASDTTADYDAKIFAIAALLSSNLIYNSVRSFAIRCPSQL
jgi:hypothetical protein